MVILVKGSNWVPPLQKFPSFVNFFSSKFPPSHACDSIYQFVRLYGPNLVARKNCTMFESIWLLGQKKTDEWIFQKGLYTCLTCSDLLRPHLTLVVRTFQSWVFADGICDALTARTLKIIHIAAYIMCNLRENEESYCELSPLRCLPTSWSDSEEHHEWDHCVQGLSSTALSASWCLKFPRLGGKQVAMQ